MADRACNRCITKKRRCDHARPVCGTCKKLKLEGECSYPPPQARRGPVAGMSRRAEHRAQQCENALWFLLNVPGVQEAIERVDPDILNRPFVPAPTASLERSSRNEWWGDHMMRQPVDVFMFRDACRQLQSGQPIPAPAEHAPPPTETFYEPACDPALEYDGYPRSRGTPQSNHGQGSSRTSPPPESQPPSRQSQSQPPDRRRDDAAMRNAMGPSLWQLVTAAIPDEDEPPTGRRSPPPAGREWPAPTVWSTPLPREEYDGPKRKRRADIFW